MRFYEHRKSIAAERYFLVTVCMVNHADKEWQKHNGKLTDIGKLSILEDHKVEFLGQLDEFISQIHSEVLNDIDMGLIFRYTSDLNPLSRTRGAKLALIMQQLFPTRLTTSSISRPFVTSTLTHKFDCLRSISSSSLFAATLFWYGIRAVKDR